MKHFLNDHQVFPTGDHPRRTGAAKISNLHIGTARLLSYAPPGVLDTFHNVSKAYLPLYLAEFSYRHNNRENADIFGDVIAQC